MTLYQCNCGATKELNKTTICVVNGKVQVKEALCNCGEYMQSTKEFSGYPTIIRPDSDTNHTKNLHNNK